MFPKQQKDTSKQIGIISLLLPLTIVISLELICVLSLMVLPILWLFGVIMMPIIHFLVLIFLAIPTSLVLCRIYNEKIINRLTTVINNN